MIKHNSIRFLIAAMLYFATSLIAAWVATPQSFINFVGPAAALVSGLMLIWGMLPVFAVILVSPLLALALNYYFQHDANLTVMIIAVMAIILQGLWTRQLVFRFILYKKWLTSRKHLFFFLLRVGPIASLTSASAVIILSILDSEVTHGSFLYTFTNTWSSSMLVAVFFIPLLLLARNAEQLRLTKRIFVGVTSILGFCAALLLLKTSQQEQQHLRQGVFTHSKMEVERLIVEEIDEVINQINSLSALFKASEEVSLREFTLFSESIFKEGSSVRALEWAPIVPFAQRQNFEQQATNLFQSDFNIKERSKAGQLIVAEQRSQYAPLFYIYPQLGNHLVLGLDVYSNPNNILSMQKVVDSQKIIASGPLTLIQDEFAKPGILFSKAIFSQVTPSELSKDLVSRPTLYGELRLIGFVVAVVKFDDFFEQLAQKKSKQVKFFIQDVSRSEPHILFGKPVVTENRYSQVIEMSVFSRKWQLSIAESQPWFGQPKTWQAWAVLIGGTLGAALFQMLVLMMAAYSSELSVQVDVKTRALILAKENSEEKSLAKSHFLQTLNTELRTPLMAIKAFVEQLKQRGINNRQVTGISHAGENVALLLDTMVDLSNIESGKVTAKQDCFDFYGFLQRTESVIKASNGYEGKSIFFLIDKSVPHYINSDELYIQKLLYALIESAHQLLETPDLRLSIKLHQHKLADASLFFTLSPQNEVIDAPTPSADNEKVHTELNANSTAMAMAIKYSQLLKGDTSLGTLSSGDGVLSASIRVVISSIQQQESQQGLTFDLME
jgi:CHASE1-domain containing sensor protein